MALSPVCVLDFTLAWEEGTTHEAIIKDLRSVSKKWAFQKESGELTGYVHWQGRLSFFKAARLPQQAQVLRALESGLWAKVHLGPSSNNSLKGPNFYVIKEQTRVDGPWTDQTEAAPQYIPLQYRGLLDRLYPWQEKVLESRNVFDSRSVNLVYDPEGNHGKSTCASLAELHYQGLDLPPITDAKELMQVACDILMAKECRTPAIVFMDLPRSMDQKRLAPFMVAIEQIKKGHVCDVRHHYKDWWFDSPQIWVFANWMPDLKFLSKDRWKLWTIDIESMDLVTYVPIVEDDEDM